jgi:hypothetical protein
MTPEVLVLNDHRCQGKSALAMEFLLRHISAGGTVVIIGDEGEHIDVSAKLRALLAVSAEVQLDRRVLAVGQALTERLKENLAPPARERPEDRRPWYQRHAKKPRR